jgi:hypothetical protein
MLSIFFLYTIDANGWVEEARWVARPESAKGVGIATNTPFADSGRATRDVLSEMKRIANGSGAQKKPGFLAEARTTKLTYGSRPSLR